MLDIKFVRENPEIVKQNIKNKFQENKLELVDPFFSFLLHISRPKVCISHFP